MKNAILSALTVLLLGGLGLWTGPAAAQTDAESDAADTDGDSSDSATEDAGEAGDTTDGADEGATDPEAAEGETPTDEGDPEPEVSEPEPEAPPEALPEATEPPAEEASTGLASPEEAAEGGEAATEEAAEEAEEAPASSGPEPLPWRNSFFTYTNSVSFNSFLRDAQLSYNPVYLQSFAFSPRWYLGPMTQLRGNVTMQLEITDTNGNALNRDPQIFDPTITLLHMVPWEGFIFMPNARLMFPLSKASQASQRYIQAGAGLTVVRIIPEVANLTLAGVFRYSRWFAGSNVVRTGDPQPDRLSPSVPGAVGVGGGAQEPQIETVLTDQLGTASAGSDVILAGISATMTPIGSFSINLSAFLFTLHGFGLAPWVSSPGQVLTSEDPVVIEDGSPSHWRNFTFVSVSVAYQFTPWLNMSLGIQNSGFAASAYNPDGSIRNPLFTTDTQAFLTATFGVDTIYNELFGETEDDLTPEERQRRQQGLASGPRVGGAF